MRKLLLFLITFYALFAVSYTRVFAHFLQTDGNIGAVLHVDPNDDPIAGSQASFFFEFKDKENKFTPQKCDCTFEIVENGNTIYSQPLFQNNSNPGLSNVSVFYTFPQRDVYQVIVVGKPNSPNAFQPFTLTWNFRVDQQATAQTGTGQTANTNFFASHMIPIIILGLLVIGFIVYIISRGKKSFTPTAKGDAKSDVKKDLGNTY